MSARTILLVRHPQTDWNRQRRYQGRTGRPCAGDVGVAASAVAGAMRGLEPDLVVSSPTRHARVLARGVAAILAPAAGARVDDAWCEIDHGTWEGLTHEAVMRRFGAGAARRFDDPYHADHGGETLVEAAARVGRGWETLMSGGGAVVAVITHATPIRVVLCRCLGLPLSMHWRFRIDPLGITRIDAAGTNTVVAMVNGRTLA